MADESQSILDSVSTGQTFQPVRVLIYGPEKVGKSSMAAQAKNVIAIDIEGRLGHIKIKKLPLAKTWEEVMTQLEALRVGRHDYQHVLIDSVSYLEKLLKRKVMEGGGWTAEEADEFQRWIKVAASSHWPDFFSACELLERERGMGIIMTAHTLVKSAKNPGGESYDKFRPALGGDIGPQLFLHYAHDVLFCTFEDLQRVEKKNGREKIKTITTGARVMYTQHTPSHDAGNSCGLPPCIPMDWNLYIKLREEGLADIDSLHDQIVALGKQVRDEEIRNKVSAYASANWGDVDVCRRIRARLVEIIAAQDAAEVPST